MANSLINAVLSPVLSLKDRCGITTASLGLGVREKGALVFIIGI